METHSGKTSEIKFLGSIIHETTSLRGRIAILTYQNLTHSILADRILIFIEHFQTVILFVFTNYGAFTNRNPVSASIINIVYPIVFSASPGSFISYTKETTSTVFLVSFFGLLLLLFKMAVFGAITLAALRNKPPSKNIQLTWQWIFKLQPRVIYYLMAPIWTSIVEATFKDLLDLHQAANNFLKVLSLLMFVCEFVFSLVLQTQFTCTLPTKNFLSSKNNITQILTLLQKFSNHSIRKILTFAPIAAVWIANFITLFLGVLKLGLYFKYLPAYDVDCLFYQMYFIVVTLALNIACTLQVIFGDHRIDMNLVIFLWILLSLLFLRISTNYLKNRLSTMVLENKETSPQCLIHKIIAVKYFWKKSGIGKKGRTDNKWTSLVKATLIKNFQKAFSITPHEELDMVDSKSRSKIFSLYLEELLLRYPKSDFIRLYAAYYFAKNQRLYGKCLRTIHELKQSTKWNIEISISVLFNNIKERIMHESKNKTFIFDISEFVQGTSLFAQAKLEIIKQAELQASLYQEMKENFPLLVRLKRFGEKITQNKLKIERTRKKLLKTIPEYYPEPLLLYAHYYLVLNHSYEKFVEHSRIYTKRFQKYLKSFKADNFCQENFYKKNTGFLIFSGEKQTQGKILYCGGSYLNIFGRNLTGSYIGIAVPSITMSDPKVLWNLIMEKQEKTIINKLQQRFYYHQNGYMTEIQYFMNISPFVQSQGLTYYVIFRPVKTHKECILINRDGLIECFTKKIGEELGLSSKLSNEERNSGKLSPELQLANEAFNVLSMDINSTQLAKKQSLFEAKESNLTLAQAQEISDSYMNDGGQILYLSKVNNSKPGSQIPYRCTIRPLEGNIHGAKEIYLEKIMERTTRLTLPEEEAEEELIDEIIDEKLPEQINSKRSHPLVTSPMSSERHLLTARSGKRKTTIQRETTDFQTEEGGILREHDTESFSHVYSRNESIFSLHSEFMGRNKIKKQKAFEETINTSHGKTKTCLLILLETCTLLFIFGLQLNLNIRIRKGFSDFGLKKDIVLTAQSRNFNITNLNSVLSVYYGKAIGLFDVGDLFLGKDLVYLRANLDQTITDLNHANTHLMEIANSLILSPDKVPFL